MKSRSLFLVCALGLMLGAVAPVAAQSLPSWARPIDGTNTSEEVGTFDDSGGGPITFPGPPTPMPFGPAGLLLLAAAGLGYGVRRLRTA